MDVNRKDEIYSLFEHVDETERKLIGPLIEQVLFLEERMRELRQHHSLKSIPRILHNRKHSSVQAVQGMYAVLYERYEDTPQHTQKGRIIGSG